jgi:Glu-tRNA(Gln) amidotransferase subunit E-like FAD-binding protein
MLSENEIRGWIAMHVNLSDYNPKIKAMGYVMKELKGKADGSIVKKILEGK